MRSVHRSARILSHARRWPEVVQCIRSSPQWPVLLGVYLGLRRLRRPLPFETRQGGRLLLTTAEDVATAWLTFFARQYEVPADARLIVDAGANIGVFSLYAALRAPRAEIVAVEPVGGSVGRLCAMVKENRLGGRVTVVPKALAAAGGDRRLMSRGGSSQERTLLPEGARGDGTEEVETVSLEELLHGVAGGRFVDLLKLDVEGAEYEVLAATPAPTLRRCRRLAVEYHPRGSKSGLFADLEDAGFVLTRDAPSGSGSGVAHFRRRDLTTGPP